MCVCVPCLLSPLSLLPFLPYLPAAHTLSLCPPTSHAPARPHLSLPPSLPLTCTPTHQLQVVFVSTHHTCTHCTGYLYRTALVAAIGVGGGAVLLDACVLRGIHADDAIWDPVHCSSLNEPQKAQRREQVLVSHCELCPVAEERDSVSTLM